MMRSTAGVNNRTNLNAVLVSLGELPLHYALALRACGEFYRIYRGKAGDAMTNLLQDFQSEHSDWTQTYFLAPAKINIDYFQGYSDDPLLGSTTSKFTRHIFPDWQCFEFPKSPYSKATECVLIKSCFEQNYTRSFKHKCNPNTSSLCRFCKSAPETIRHLFLECECFNKQRETLRSTIGETELSLPLILGAQETMRSTEIFISSSKFVQLL